MSIEVSDISQYFGDQAALENVSLDIKEGEFFSLLGPSGCGKTTLLNIIAGFLYPTTGTVNINGNEVTDLPPYRRKIGMVFQNYALFPHLNVFDNVAYGLKVQKLPKKEIKERVHESLSLVKLEAFAKRMPQQLSGGQQQRVAMARALAIRPSVLLLDEPLSNLDAKLRKEMQTELRLLQQKIGITTVMVTHDQEEALSMSDRIGVLGEGRVKQIGEPLHIYRQPENRFVAEFIGQANLLEVTPADHPPEDDRYCYFHADHYQDEEGEPLKLKVLKENLDGPAEHCPLLMIRPERIHISDQASAEHANEVKTEIQHVNYQGNAIQLEVGMQGKGTFQVQVSDSVFVDPPEIGMLLYISWKNEDMIPLAGEESQNAPVYQESKK
ncbi:ABC transporter ATP-binding protein [Alteribacillus iranensis]|uniref:Spermidine/putrescine import ATP-binding protein PotA n=1 Tax=Alteribacillus iranensis TaxID=930128 RepID=A0A1I2BE39_9BACI|nr:ABC transporter ATP-binding protein [Alteribacillus iranensis]SFE54431.1 putative spermidine/putrescine transport system ATP-binding protein [Alteribacillus iranensis]